MKKIKFVIKNFQLYTEDIYFEFSDIPNVGDLIKIKTYLPEELLYTFEYELSKTYYSEYGKVIEKIWDKENEISFPILILELSPRID